MIFSSDYILEDKKELKKLCPKCSWNLIIRKNSKTKKDFICCTQYPECRYTDEIVVESSLQMNLFDMTTKEKENKNNENNA